MVYIASTRKGSLHLGPHQDPRRCFATQRAAHDQVDFKAMIMPQMPRSSSIEEELCVKRYHAIGHGGARVMGHGGMVAGG